MATTTHTDLWHEIIARGVPALAQELTDAEAVQMTERFGAHNYKPLPVNIVKADGAEAWDGTGRRYLDCIGAYSAVAHGHLSERIVAAINDQLQRLSVTSRAFYTSEVALFMKGLAEYCGLDMVCPMNTGAEANETCIKLARKWAYTVKGIPDDQAEIIVCQDNFHGRTTTIVGFSTEPGYKAHFGPFTPGFKLIPFGDMEALRNAVTPNTAAFLVEPIQAEGGIIIPPDGWMADVRKFCTENRVLLIWDEVQTGFCRTGRRFAWQYEDAEPDLLAVGKPLGGGVMPVAAAVGKAEVMEVFKPGDHGSTFGGNPLGAVVALTALAEMEVEDFAGQATRKSERFVNGLKSLDSPFIREIRARGLLIGMEVDPGLDSYKLTHEFLHNGILTKETRHRTFRFTPPIVITDAQIDEAIGKIGASLAALG